MKKHYVNSTELEAWWQDWLNTGDPRSWDEMADRIYRICQGIATRFNPKDEEDFQEHVHDAFIQTMEKIRTGKLRFIAGKAPVFNLMTTTIFRILYSKMNHQKKQRDHMRRYTYQFVQQVMPEYLNSVEFPFTEGHNKRSCQHSQVASHAH